MRLKTLKNLIFIIPMLTISNVAIADDDNVPPIKNSLVIEECGSCHLAFQPAFLPKQSWEYMMNNLEDHFGEDASLDQADLDTIKNYLVANSRTGKNVNANNPPLRITELRWFKHEHSEREAKNMMKKLKVKSFVECAACHRGADKGLYDDD